MATSMAELRERLKVDIGIINSTIYNERLDTILQASKASVEQWIGDETNIDDSLDAELIIDYARWQWITRREPTSMSDSLKYRLNCRAFAPKKVGGSDS